MDFQTIRRHVFTADALGGDGCAVKNACWLVPQVANGAREAWRRVSSGQPWPYAAAPALDSTGAYHNRSSDGDVFRRGGRDRADSAVRAAASAALRGHLRPGAGPSVSARLRAPLADCLLSLGPRLCAILERSGRQTTIMSAFFAGSLLEPDVCGATACALASLPGRRRGICGARRRLSTGARSPTSATASARSATASPSSGTASAPSGTLSTSSATASAPSRTVSGSGSAGGAAKTASAVASSSLAAGGDA